MRPLVTAVIATVAMLLSSAPAADANRVSPRSAKAFSDSVGISTHIVYYDSAYGNWTRAVSRLEELGVRHIRDGVYANPTGSWRDWNERYYQAVELAAERGLRFTFGMGRPGFEAGTLDQLIEVVAGRLRRATEALEAPNEFDHYVGGRRWPARLTAYNRSLFRKANANRSLRPLPIVGPSFATPRGPQLVGDQRSWMDVGNIHPYTGGLSPDPAHVRSELARARVTAGPKRVWATEAGFHNALRVSSGQPGVSEAVGAVYLLRTFLEHFKGGIDRTYAYELVDPYPEPSGRDSEQHFGLLRHDLSAKPAFRALKNLLALTGHGTAPPRLRPLRLRVSARGVQVRKLLLQEPDGTYLLALWRLSSLWDREERRPLRPAQRPVTVRLPSAGRVAVADPVDSAALRPLRLRRGAVRVALGGRPVLLHITPANRRS